MKPSPVMYALIVNNVQTVLEKDFIASLLIQVKFDEYIVLDPQAQLNQRNDFCLFHQFQGALFQFFWANQG